jgi:5-methylcytosine-specific restriction endonuclease McrBC GTP-binding regulatory subunit McrB
VQLQKRRQEQEELKKYIFIIDEINRGEISKIFGELFFAIDPGYRGRAEKSPRSIPSAFRRMRSSTSLTMFTSSVP